MIRLLVIYASLLIYTTVHGQTNAVYNINKYNGLTSDHVYCTLVDKLGYLWIGTTDGVYRYNGYKLAKYSYDEGLSNNDVWSLYADKKGRIWLKTISNELGYIKNNIYTEVTNFDSSGEIEIYPSDISEIGDSILFTSRGNKGHVIDICVVIHDTIFHHLINNSLSQSVPFIYASMSLNNKKTTTFYTEAHKSIFKIINTNKLLSTQANKTPDYDTTLYLSHNLHKICTIAKKFTLFANRFFIYGDIHDGKILYYDITHFKDTSLTVTDITNNESTILYYIIKNSLIILTDKAAYYFDDHLNFTHKYDLSTYLKTETLNTNTHFIQDSMWGSCISNNTSGLYIHFNKADHIEKHTIKELDLNRYHFSGYKNDSTGYWWAPEQEILAELTNGKVTNTIQVKGAGINKKIIAANNKLIMLNKKNTHFIWPNGTITESISDVDTLCFERTTIGIEHYKKASDYALSFISDCKAIDNNSFYFSGGGYNGLNKATYNYRKRTIFLDSIYYERFEHIELNKKNHLLLCYTSTKILMHNTLTKKNVIISNKILKLLGIISIKQVQIDDQGNVFIKDHNNLYVYNIFSHHIKQLFKNYPMSNAIIRINNNRLLIAGSFGVLKAQIAGKGRVNHLQVYPNSKNLYYKYITDIQFSSNLALMRTDKGIYSVNISHNTSHSSNNNYKFIIDNNDSLYSLNNGDTIIVDQKVNSIKLDVIKPTGSGEINVLYSVNNKPSEKGEQIIFGSLKPNSYNKVTIVASDNNWRSVAIKGTIYVQPYWWQTTTAKRVIFILSLIFIATAIYLIVYITRKVTNKNNDRRNQRRELELKSIYSQINPHFIFNSLSTAQYFVKKNRTKEAYEHINQFSDLLRSYIKSSRNKYISIKEEVVNLQNYLQLQLARFEEKFDYSIYIDPQIDQRNIKIPSLLLQPLVENALNHGIFHMDKTKKGLLKISFNFDPTDKKTLLCIVEDNGIGRVRSKELRSEIRNKVDSYGSILIKELIDAFNKYESITIEIEYIDKVSPETGTIVAIHIKNYVYE